MKKSIIAIAVLTAIISLNAGELIKPAGYQVFPGNWYKALLNDKTLGKGIDPDHDRTANKRKGMLTDGKIFQRAACYNYHGAIEAQRFITVVVDLGKEYAVDKVAISAVENNSGYKPGKYTVEVSSDNMVFKPFAEGDKWEKGATDKHYTRVAEVTANPEKCRYVRVKVWAKAAWINLTEIGVYGK